MAKIDKITYMNNNTEYELEGFTPDNAGSTDDVLTKTADGYKWAGMPPSTATVDSTAPANPVQGQLWYDTANSVLMVYDGSARV